MFRVSIKQIYKIFYYYVILFNNNLYICREPKHKAMKNFRKFINDCYPDHVIGKTYDVVSNLDEEIYVRVEIKEMEGWKIIVNEHFNIDNDAKREMVFSKIDELTTIK